MRRRNSISIKRKRKPDVRKTTKGKSRNFRTVKEGAGMTAKGVAAYRRKNPGSKGKYKRSSKSFIKDGSTKSNSLEHWVKQDWRQVGNPSKKCGEA